ncbi:hypothetical protein WA026_003082 [Henosepilachna vigintioctopunctata]|uniref:Essential protein Yae1 N-terminal domain-containing protein n=1 Tax=Henosepilachna vigintioctopunctata TaxID=420089 RepID=A0AAW1TM07_9CUCU
MSESTENDAEKDIINKTFLRMKSNLVKEGYREGIEQGKQNVYQQYFDQGYMNGFQNGYRLGRLKGISWAKFTFDNSSQPNIDVLRKTSTAACILCNEENLLSKSISDIRNNQIYILDRLIDDIQNKKG